MGIKKRRRQIHPIVKCNHPIFYAFAHMKSRCYNTNDSYYKSYGAKGVKICEDWLANKHLFFDWSLKNGWQPSYEIDRINSYGNYEPSNCRWVTFEVSVKNRRGVTVDQITQSLHLFNGNKSKAALHLKVDRKTIYNKMRQIFHIYLLI